MSTTDKDFEHGKRCNESENNPGNILFECPGCNCLHCVSTTSKNGMGSQWSFNGNFEKPTFNPSILVKANYTSPNRSDDICHSFVTDGRIRFLDDCTHALKGQTVDLPLWDES